jgi:hypothetical protein
MRVLIIAVTIITMAIAGNLLAQETDPARQIAEHWQTQQALRTEREERLNELMSIMAKEMEAIDKASNSGQRQQLMVNHRIHMHESMDLMRDLGGVHLREVMTQHLGSHHDVKHGMQKALGDARQTSPSIPREQISDAARLSDLETRVDMMQIMLESMLSEQAKR